MKYYQKSLQRHLDGYARRRLGLTDRGSWKGRVYGHILPPRLARLNILEATRAELQDYLRAHREIKLHEYFHHLNSSQAFAFNLFFPYFSAGGPSASALSAALGIPGKVGQWGFEEVASDDTNVDVTWKASGGMKVFCEVKLSEAAFGSAKNDGRHRRKLEELYRGPLSHSVAPELLAEHTFFKNYQLMRNIWLVSGRSNAHLVLLLPSENEGLRKQLEEVIKKTAPAISGRIRVRYVEELLRNLADNKDISAPLRYYAEAMQEKYVP